jgi:hypothetical protein
MSACHYIKLPRRVLRTSRCEFLFSREPQSETCMNLERRTRFMSKLIHMMGLDGHRNRITLAYEYINLQNTEPVWSNEYDLLDPCISIVLNCPIDLKMSKEFLISDEIEWASANSVTSYIWLNSQFKQETNTIECICGELDNDCVSGC